MADASGPMDMHKVSLCYAKLFQQQAAFAAEQASLFAKIAAGDDEALDAVLKMPDPGKREDAEGGKNGKKRKKRDPNQPKCVRCGWGVVLGWLVGRSWRWWGVCACMAGGGHQGLICASFHYT